MQTMSTDIASLKSNSGGGGGGGGNTPNEGGGGCQSNVGVVGYGGTDPTEYAHTGHWYQLVQVQYHMKVWGGG